MISKQLARPTNTYENLFWIDEMYVPHACTHVHVDIQYIFLCMCIRVHAHKSFSAHLHLFDTQLPCVFNRVDTEAASTNQYSNANITDFIINSFFLRGGRCNIKTRSVKTTRIHLSYMDNNCFIKLICFPNQSHF